MMEIIKGEKGNWIDIVKPTEKDLEWLKKKYHFHPVILEELKEPSARPRVEGYDNYLYFIYQFPVFDEIEMVSRRNEIDILVTKRDVITVHYEGLQALEEAKRSFSRPSVRKEAFRSQMHLTYFILKKLIEFSQRQLDHIDEKVEAVAKKLFKNHEKEVLREISYLKRDLSEYRIIVRSQEHFIKSLLEAGVKFWGTESRVYLHDVLGDYIKLANQLEDYRQAVSDFEDTNNQLMNIKTTEVAKTFTILSFMTFPFVLLAAIFSMNTRDTPLVSEAHGFWIILAIMASGMLGMFTFFKKKGWL